MNRSEVTSKGVDRRELRYCWGGRFDSENNVGWHQHDETELVSVREGRCRIKVDGLTLDGAKGALFILPAGVPQFQETSQFTGTTFLGVQIPPDLFDASARVLPLAESDPILHWIEQLCDWQEVRPPMSEAGTHRLLEVLLRRIRELDVALGTRSQLHPAVVAAIKHLQQNLTHPLSLGNLARQAGVSASHLGALFAEECGCSPMQYLQRYRLERACWLLDNPYLRIHEVAEACGYEDVNYFVRLFSRRYGQPPGRWRKTRASSPRASSR